MAGGAGQVRSLRLRANGFLRTFRGSISSTTKANVRVESRYDVDDDTVELTIVNLGKNDCRITVDNAYGDDGPITRRLRSGQSDRQRWNLRKTFGWYDLVGRRATWRTAATG